MADGDTEDSVSFSGVKDEAKSRDELPLSLVLSDLRCTNEKGDTPRDAVGVLLVDEERWRVAGLGVNWSLRSREKSEYWLLEGSGHWPRTSSSTLCSDGELENKGLVGIDDDLIG